MSFRIPFSCSRAARFSHIHPIRLHVPAVFRGPVRFLSDQPASHNGKGKESSYARNTLRGAEESTNGNEQKARSAHAQWYSEFLPGMIPIALLGSAVYIGLQLVQTKLANEKYMDEANARMAQLEGEIKRLQSEQEARARDRAASGSAQNGSDAKRSSSRWWWLA